MGPGWDQYRCPFENTGTITYIFLFFLIFVLLFETREWDFMRFQNLFARSNQIVSHAQRWFCCATATTADVSCFGFLRYTDQLTYIITSIFVTRLNWNII